MGKARNNIARLSAEARLRISTLLDDGATYDEVRRDPAVAKACAERGGLNLHDTSFQAWTHCAEHLALCAERRSRSAETGRRRLAAYLVEGDREADDLARVAGYELLRQVLAKLEAGAELDSRELSGLSRVLSGWCRSRQAEQDAAARQAAEAQKAKYEARIQELEAKVAELSAPNAANATLTDEQVAAIRERLGV